MNQGTVSVVALATWAGTTGCVCVCVCVCVCCVCFLQCSCWGVIAPWLLLVCRCWLISGSVLPL